MSHLKLGRSPSAVETTSRLSMVRCFSKVFQTAARLYQRVSTGSCIHCLQECWFLAPAFQFEEVGDHLASIKLSLSPAFQSFSDVEGFGAWYVDVFFKSLGLSNSVAPHLLRAMLSEGRWAADQILPSFHIIHRYKSKKWFAAWSFHSQVFGPKHFLSQSLLLSKATESKRRTGLHPWILAKRSWAARECISSGRPDQRKQ